MEYTNAYRQLKGIFNLSDEIIHVPGSSTVIRNFDFISDGIPDELLPGACENAKIAQNYAFRYPVIIPSQAQKFSRVILYLHGLNERNWLKHLPGAMLLAERTGNPVIMFPLSYHINRGLPDWTDIHKMADPLETRKSRYAGLREASVLNLSLSERLTESPIRFFTSGQQSAFDLIKLKNEIYAGHHPLFEYGTQPDIFAYSISCLLLQVMMISDPGAFPRDSHIVFFAGGSLFSHMNGVSRFIMDNVAFSRIFKYYLDMITPTGKLQFPGSWFQKNNFGRAFTWMLGKGPFDKKRERSLRIYQPNLMVIALKNDTVMPLEGIRSAFGEKFSRSGNFRILHFPYPYFHENPFPVLNNKIDKEVNQAFRSVYEPVSDFLGNHNGTNRQSLYDRKIDHKAAAFSG
jgi:hypothetical protein